MCCGILELSPLKQEYAERGCREVFRGNGKGEEKVMIKREERNRKKRKADGKKISGGWFCSVGAKIFGLIILMAVVSVTVILSLASSLNHVNSANRKVMEVQVAQVEKISEISRDFSYINGQVLTHVMTTRESSMQSIGDIITGRIEELDKKTADFDALLDETDTRRGDFERFIADYARYKKTVKSLLGTSVVNKQQAMVSATSNLSMFESNIEEYIDAIIADTNEAMRMEQAEIDMEASRTPAMILSAFLVFAVILLLTITIISLSVVRPLRKAAEQVGTIVEEIKENRGDLTRRVTVSSRDEVGRLAQKMNDFLELVQKITASMIICCDALDNQEKIVETSVKNAEKNADNTSGMVEELAAGMQEVAATVTTLSEETGSMEDSVTEMTDKASEGSRFAQEIKGKAYDVEQTALNSKKEAVSMLASIDTAVNQSVENSRQIKKITELTDVILGIAGKTNLLALNASIEAARAGEAGRGFSVVAEEIRRLADNSRQTAGHIQNISTEVVKNVQTLAENAETLLAFIHERVLADYDMLEKTGKEYFTSADTIDSMMQEFKINTNDTLLLVSRVSKANSGINVTMGESAQEITGVAGNTSDLSQNLKKIAEAFQEVNGVIEQLKGNVEHFVKY